jgi:Na+/H+-dicarboxylate symporter
LSLVALAAGLLLGILGHGSDGGVRVFADLVRPLGDLWIAALQMLAVPLMIVYTLAAIVGTRGRQAVGVLAGRAVLLFAAMLLGAALITMAVAPWVVRLYPADRATLEALAAATRVPESLRHPAGAGAASLGAWISSLVPRNVFEAAVRGDVLPLLLFTALLGIAIARLPLEQRGPLLTSCRRSPKRCSSALPGCSLSRRWESSS